MSEFLDKTLKAHKYKKLLPYLVLAILLALSVLAWQFYENTTLEKEERRYNKYVDRVIDNITERLHQYEMILLGGARIFVASEEVTREGWQTYYQYQQVDAFSPGIQGIVFSKVVRPPELAQHIEEIRVEGFPGYKVWPAGDREVYAPVIFLEPFNEINRHALGYDGFSEPVRRAAMERAMDTDTVTITGMVTLATETDQDSQPGFLMYVPVYTKGMPLNTPEERREAINGFVLGGFFMQDLIQDIFPDPMQNISFQIFDGAEISADTLFYDSHVSPNADNTENQPLFTSQKTLDLYGHQWTLAFETTPAFEAAVDRSASRGILATGLLLSFLAFFYLKTLEATGDRAHSLAQEMTSALKESEQKYRYMTENISDVIWSVDLEGNITYMSPAIENLIGFSAEEVMAMPITDYIIQEDYDAVIAKLTEELAKPPAERDRSVIMPVRHKTKDNRLVQAEFSASWLLDEQGNLIGVQGTTRDITERLQAQSDLLQAYDATIEGWAYALDLKDEETEDHSQRVTKYTLQIARKMGIKDKELVHVKRGALLHDIGKMGIPDSILLKPGPLTDEEWKVMRKHPVYAYEMLSRIDYLRPAIDIPYCHHEKWDGSGYPRGLKGEKIPLPARIFTVVDVYDALTSDRPYRKAWSREEALEHIRKESGKHFDPEVVEVFLQEIV